MQTLVVNSAEEAEWGPIREGNQNGFFLETEAMESGRGYMAKLGGELLLLSKDQGEEISFYSLKVEADGHGQITRLGLHLLPPSGDDA